MLSDHVQLADPHTYIIYTRYSDDKQNERSSEQQVDEIHRIIKRDGHPWRQLKIYADRGESGKRQSRPEFNRMIRDIETGIVRPHFILTDTSERCGRNDQVGIWLDRLKKRYGVIRLVANLNFQPPTGLAGIVTSAFENVRAETENMVKSHQVSRGKRDLVKQGYWPGGPVPFGYMLAKEVVRVGGRDKFRSRLKRSPESDWIRAYVIKLASEGTSSLFITRKLNDDPRVPDHFKPFEESLVRRMIIDPIAIGTFMYPKVERDIINDINVSRRRPDEEVGEYKNFVEPISDEETFRRAQATRVHRTQKVGVSRTDPERTCVRGLKITSPLAGLVFCSECGRRMTPITSGRRSKTGTVYSYYHCSRAVSGACTNGRYVDRIQLELAVFQRLRERLLPINDQSVPDWFAPFVETVQRKLHALKEDGCQSAEVKVRRSAELARAINGWTLSLASPELNAPARNHLANQLSGAQDELSSLQVEIASAVAESDASARVLDPADVLSELKRLEQTLALDNPALLNMELMKHIIRIVCHPDGSILLEGTYVGLFNGLHHLSAVQSTSTLTPMEGADVRPFTASSRASHTGPRRLTPRDTGESMLDGGADELAATKQIEVLSTERYDHLAPEFVWGARLLIEARKPPSALVADEIVAYMSRNPTMPLYKVAEHFGRTPYFIRKARQHHQKRSAIEVECTTSKDAGDGTPDVVA